MPTNIKEGSQLEQEKRFADIPVITSDNAEFYLTEGGFLGIRFGQYSGRVTILRAFPLTMPDRYLSVRDQESHELGILMDRTKLEPEQAQMVLNELERWYFVPDILEVFSVKEEFGYQYWDTDTTAGKRSFVITDISNNLIKLGEKKIMLVDVDGNRYQIPDVSRAGAKALKYIDIWL